MTTLNLSVSFRGTTHTISAPSDTSLLSLQETLEGLTTIPPSLQKLLSKGKKLPSESAESSLESLGLKDGSKITMLGSTNAQIGEMAKVEKEEKRRQDILAQRQRRAPTKLRSTLAPTASSLTYRFHKIESLQHLPNPVSAQRVLERLASDPAIRYVMSTHKFSVGLLTELAPHEHPELLGLNVNAGQAIKLRLRTNAYDGMRTYKEIRRVLCHELTHNVWGEHDNNFKELNSQLNREVASYEQDVQQNTHTLSGPGGSGHKFYQPTDDSSDDEDYGSGRTANILGGNGSGERLMGGRDEIRTKALEASLKRLAQEEREIEDRCGSDGPAALK